MNSTVHLDRWVQWMRAAGRSPATVRTRLAGMKTLCRHAGVQAPEALTAEQVAAWLADCDKPWTRSTYWMTVRCWVGWALAEGVICVDPTARLAKPRTPRCVPRPVSDAVIRQLLAVVSNRRNNITPELTPRVRAYVALAALAGLRVHVSDTVIRALLGQSEAPPTLDLGGTSGEATISRVRAYVALAALAGLRVHQIAKIRGEDVDLDAGWLFVDGKGGQRAAIPLHPQLAALARGLPEVGYWFPGRDSGHVSGAWVSACVTRALRSVGSNATAHQLRHSFGTAVLRSSHDLRVTQELLRHASPASTAIYTAVAASDKVDAIRRLGWVV